MDASICTAFRNGYERMAAWSGLLDDINLYPVPDADTGRNLRISLAPLKTADHIDTARQLLMSATGNSGNIAGAFFSKFINVISINDLLSTSLAGKEAAWAALMDPKPGTILAVFDALVETLSLYSTTGPQTIIENHDSILKHIENAVFSTATLLPELREAGVVDSGAMGMYLFFEGFFKSISQTTDSLINPHQVFGNRLNVLEDYRNIKGDGFCIDTVIIPGSDAEKADHEISALGEHLVTVRDGDYLKIHFHAADDASARENLSSVGQVLQWHSEKIENRIFLHNAPAKDIDRVHIVTDAAGSLTLDAARKFDITLLDSYILVDDRHLPETMVDPDNLYAEMKRGSKVSTAQASNFERHQRYEYLVRNHKSIVYLCVGSAYTGNFDTASRWASESGNSSNMVVLDTGAASGRLGLIATEVSRYAKSGKDMAQTVSYAKAVSRKCDELIFLDQLKFLAAGGRISKANGFFGDILKIKPVIRPGSRGAQKVAAVRSQNGQVSYALKHLGSNLNRDAPAQILLQYTDNRDWIMSDIYVQIQTLMPKADIMVNPMSLTSGVHMGPGTWAVAFLPGDIDPA